MGFILLYFVFCFLFVVSEIFVHFVYFILAPGFPGSVVVHICWRCLSPTSMRVRVPRVRVPIRPGGYSRKKLVKKLACLRRYDKYLNCASASG